MTVGYYVARYIADSRPATLLAKTLEPCIGEVVGHTARVSVSEMFSETPVYDHFVLIRVSPDPSLVREHGPRTAYIRAGRTNSPEYEDEHLYIGAQRLVYCNLCAFSPFDGAAAAACSAHGDTAPVHASLPEDKITIHVRVDWTLFLYPIVDAIYTHFFV